MALAYIFYPLYSFLNKKIKKRNLSAILISTFVVIILVFPLFLAVNIASKETYTLYLMSKQRIVTGDLFNMNCEESTSSLCTLSSSLKGILSDPQTSYYLTSGIQKISSFFIDSIGGFVLKIPVIFLNFFIMVFITFFLLRDGKQIVAKLKKLLPLEKPYQKHIVKKVEEVTSAVIFGHIIVAMIQGALGGIGFFIFGVTSPLLWGIMMFFAALIPFVGTPLIWLPAAIFKILSGMSNNQTGTTIQGILLVLYGMFIVGTIDNILKPKIIGKKADVHPILVLLGVLGGLKMFGIIGIIAGPIILAVFMTFVRIYEHEKGLIS